MFNKCKLIYTDHTKNEIELISNFWKIIGKYFLSYSYGAVGIAPDVSYALCETFDIKPVKVTTIPNAVDIDRFNLHIDVVEKRRVLGINKSDKVIAMVGNLREQKNHQNQVLQIR